MPPIYHRYTIWKEGCIVPVSDILKYSAAALILGVTLVICAITVSDRLKDIKTYRQSEITVTGSASQDITSDLIVWGGDFSRKADTTKEAYDLLKSDAAIISNYLSENGVEPSEIVFSAISSMQSYRTEYVETNEGTRAIDYPDGFTLSQSVNITSEEVDKIDGISRDITQLIDAGVTFYSRAPEYYYTKLDELRLEMIEKASANARTRAEIMAENANAELGELITATLGVFQITATNSASEEFSSSGVLNTWSKLKTASVTARLSYAVK